MTTELRTLRWGSVEQFSLPLGGDGKPSRTLPRQMLQLSWDVPLSWVVWLVMNPILNGDETHTFTVQWNFTIGVGQATATTSAITFTFAPSGVSPAITFAPQQQQLFIPGQDIQLNATLIGTASSLVSAEAFQVAAFGAPNNADVLGEMRRWEAQSGVQVDPRSRDMAMGGPHETPLHYMPR